MFSLCHERMRIGVSMDEWSVLCEKEHVESSVPFLSPGMNHGSYNVKEILETFLSDSIEV
jgi:hypothetical protein